MTMRFGTGTAKRVAGIVFSATLLLLSLMATEPAGLPPKIGFAPPAPALFGEHISADLDGDCRPDRVAIFRDRFGTAILANFACPTEPAGEIARYFPQVTEVAVGNFDEDPQAETRLVTRTSPFRIILGGNDPGIQSPETLVRQESRHPSPWFSWTGRTTLKRAARPNQVLFDLAFSGTTPFIGAPFRSGWRFGETRHFMLPRQARHSVGLRAPPSLS